MDNLLQKLKDWYTIEVKDNTAVFMSEYFHIKVSRNIREIMAANSRQGMRREDAMKRELYQECARKSRKYFRSNKPSKSIGYIGEIA